MDQTDQIQSSSAAVEDLPKRRRLRKFDEDMPLEDQDEAPANLVAATKVSQVN